MIKAIIIDDEQLARDVIRKFLEDFDQIEIAAECANGFEGIKAIAEHQPELLFLDVQMPKLTGFEMLELLDPAPVIVFSTAYDQYAIKAFELSAADYLLKPYSRDRFKEAVNKALDKIHKPEENKKSLDKLQESSLSKEKIDRIVIRSGSKLTIISVDDIDYIEAQDDYVEVHSAGKKYLKQMTMKALENSLPDEFVRVHRSAIIHIDRLDKIEPYSKDSYVAILKSGEKVSVSRSGYQLLKEKLGF
ncbi:MAG: LytTR family transcriptional regulator DNA-binding domain-containing protein [Fulvivirga sp.]|uniref:LytR/AlgR family response regulator transcription factor n=1 Tax=Fulvivirga sp. TaxID=1931237 RepID=UPI0032EC1817